jgi:hypothetical protein
MRHNNSRGQAGPARVSPSETQCSAAGSVLQSRRRRWPMPRMLIFVIVVGNSRLSVASPPWNGNERCPASRMDRPVADVQGRVFLFRFFVACMLGFPSKLLATHAHNPKTPHPPKPRHESLRDHVIERACTTQKRSELRVLNYVKDRRGDQRG